MLFCFQLYNSLEVGNYISHGRETRVSQNYKLSHSFVANISKKTLIRVVNVIVVLIISRKGLANVA